MEPRRNKKRELHYVKCERCRADKQKCLPIDRIWPDRCERCANMKVPCSEGTVKSRKKRKVSSGATRVRNVESPCKRDMLPGPLMAATGTSSLAFPRTHISSSGQPQELDRTEQMSDDHNPLLDWAVMVCFREMVLLAKTELRGLEDELLNKLSDYGRYALFYQSRKTDVLTDLASSLQEGLDSQLSSIIRTGKIRPEHIAHTISYVMNGLQADRSPLGFPWIPYELKKFLELIEPMGHAERNDWELDYAPDYLLLFKHVKDWISRLLCDSDYMNSLDVPSEVKENLMFVPMGTLPSIPPGGEYYLLVFLSVFPDCLGRTWLHRYLDDKSHPPSPEDAQEIFKLIRSRRYPGLRKDILGRTQLHVASTRGDVLMALELLARESSFVNSQTYWCQTSLHLAAASGHLGVCRILLECSDIDIWSKDAEGRTALYVALCKDQVDVYKFLVEQSRYGIENHHKQAHLIYACRYKSYDIMQHIIDRYHCLNKQYSDSALAFSPQDHNLPGLRKELFGNHHATSFGDDWTPLMHAVWGCNIEVVKFLCKQPGIDFNLRDRSGRTALFLAAAFDLTEEVDHILSYPDVNPNQADVHGRTPLNAAAVEGSKEAVESLLADPRVEISRYKLSSTEDGVICDFENEIKDPKIRELLQKERDRRAAAASKGALRGIQFGF